MIDLGEVTAARAYGVRRVQRADGGHPMDHPIHFSLGRTGARDKARGTQLHRVELRKDARSGAGRHRHES